MRLAQSVTEDRVYSAAVESLRKPSSGQKWMSHGQTNPCDDPRLVAIAALAIITEPIVSVVAIDDFFGDITGAFAIGQYDYIESIAMHFTNPTDNLNGWKVDPRWPDNVIHSRNNAAVSGVPTGYIRLHRGATSEFLAGLADSSPNGFDVAILGSGLFDGWEEVVRRSRIAIICNKKVAIGAFPHYRVETISSDTVVVYRGFDYPTMSRYIESKHTAPRKETDGDESKDTVEATDEDQHEGDRE